MGNQSFLSSFVLAAALGAVTATTQAQSLIDRIDTAITGGRVNVNMRFRHESVAQDNSLADAAASTLRTRLTLQSAQVEGLSALLEVDNVSIIGADRYDSFITNKYRGTHSVIADPVGTEINQAFLQYDAGNSFSGRLGTQRILHAGQRFIGGVGWRQNEQTFDALSGTYRGGKLALDYSYVWNVNRVFNSSKTSVQLTDLDSDSHLVLASRQHNWGTLNGYVYALDFDNAAGLSSLTWGLSYAGKWGPLTINAAAARQSDYGGNPLTYTAGYFSADGAVAAGPVTVTAGIEVLGSDQGVKAFSTPLATLHKWQGWADMFLGTPDAGIEDRFFSLAGNAGNLSLSATWHNFRSEFGNGDYGTEWDLLANYPFNDRVSAQLKYATYDSNGFAVDTNKLWIMLNVAF